MAVVIHYLARDAQQTIAYLKNVNNEIVSLGRESASFPISVAKGPFMVI